MSDQTKREIRLVDQLQPGDVIVDTEDGPGGDPIDVYRTVRVAEPIAESPGRYLVVYAGAHTDNVRSTEDYAIATREEIAAHQAMLADAEKRARIRAGLMRVVELIDDGLPLPAFLRVEMPCMPDHESVREVAKAIGIEPAESLNGGRPQTDAETVLAVSPQGREEVEFKAWHLASKPVES